MSAYQEQKRTKPPIDVLAQAYLTGETQAKLMAFVAFLRENRMTPQWGSTNSYNLSFKNRRVCIIKIEKDSYQLWLNTQYNDEFDACFQEADEETRQYLRDRIQYCFGCGSCKPGIDREILGVACKGACFNPVLLAQMRSSLSWRAIWCSYAGRSSARARRRGLRILPHPSGCRADCGEEKGVRDLRTGAFCS